MDRNIKQNFAQTTLPEILLTLDPGTVTMLPGADTGSLPCAVMLNQDHQLAEIFIEGDKAGLVDNYGEQLDFDIEKVLGSIISGQIRFSSNDRKIRTKYFMEIMDEGIVKRIKVNKRLANKYLDRRFSPYLLQ